MNAAAPEARRPATIDERMLIVCARGFGLECPKQKNEDIAGG